MNQHKTRNLDRGNALVPSGCRRRHPPDEYVTFPARPPTTLVMEPELNKRPQWEIDHKLESLIGVDIRVAAKAFSPARWNGGEKPPLLMPVRDLFLPDNTQPEGLPVFFEGRLQHFDRQIGVVFVWLDSPASLETATDGPVYFRGSTAVILRGPAAVELASPFQVERLPVDPDNYSQDLRVPRAQFEFPFSATVAGEHPPAIINGNVQTAISRDCEKGLV